MLSTQKMFKISCSNDMLDRLKSYTAKHRSDEDADKNILISTKIAKQLSDKIMGNESNELFTYEELNKIEQALNENKDKTKIYRSKVGQHYSLEPILNDGKYCSEKKCDIAGIYSIPKEYKIIISGGRLRFEDSIYLVDNKGEPSLGVYKDDDIQKIELKKVQPDVIKHKKTMKDIEKNIDKYKSTDTDKEHRSKNHNNNINIER